MKKITLLKVLHSLENMEYEVKVAPDVSRRARGAIEKMIQIQ
jgi:quinolinate synthase